MEENTAGPDTVLVELAADVVSAYVSNNVIVASEIPGVIQNVFDALKKVSDGSIEAPQEQLKPAVPIKKSVTDDYIICLEDGKKLKMLKRHLKTSYDMSPEDYRERWGLAADYPMVAPNYAKKRSALAKDIGLGTRGR